MKSSDVLALLNSHSELAEKQLICKMIETDDFINVPVDYIYNTKIRELYMRYFREFEMNGSVNFVSVEISQQELLSECMEVSTPKELRAVLNDLKKHYKIRRYIKEAMRGARKIIDDDNNISLILNDANKLTTELLTEDEKCQSYSHGHSVMDWLSFVKEAKDSNNELRGYSSGPNLPDIDTKINGWELGKMYLVSGLEKLGKSRFTRALVSYWLSENYGCAFFMLEEDADAIHECIICNRTTINTDVIGTNSLNDYDFSSLMKSANVYMNQPLYVSNRSAIDPQYIISAIRSQKIKMKKEYNADLMFVVVDYVQRMSENLGSKHENMEKIASELANIARDENVCMIVVSQMNSNAEKVKGVPVHTQQRYGKALREAASCMITFDHSKDDEDEEEKDYRTIKAHIRQRKGVSEQFVYLRAQLQYSQYFNFVRG